VKRLFPVNEPLTAAHGAVLKIIAAELGCPMGAVYIGEGASGPAVFYEDTPGSNGTRCACDLSSPYGQVCQAKVVATNDQKRFELSADGQRIRAVQGHSTRSVQRHFEPRQPPDLLFHGTASRFVAAIDREGLKPGARHHVHLSADEQTARCVGLRYGLPVVLAVDAARMHAQGFVFHQAENGVWLTARVPPAFLCRAG
jgi:hypothetical protein